MVVLRVRRWSPDAGERWQVYRVDAGPDTTVLDGLVAAQREQDPTLAFRYACRVGMCGTCGVVVDGRERWACRTRLGTLGRGTVTVRPLYHLPVLRDLVVDLAPFARHLARAGAVFDATEGAAPYALVPGGSAERREIDAAIECIGCAMCLSACTPVARHERFPGPAALNRLFTLERDRRDGGGTERWRLLLSDDGLARCRGQANCVEVCPMGLAPAESIARLRRMAVRRLVGLGR